MYSEIGNNTYSRAEIFLSLMIKNGIEIRMGQIKFCHTAVVDFLNLLLVNCDCLNQDWVW